MNTACKCQKHLILLSPLFLSLSLFLSHFLSTSSLSLFFLSLALSFTHTHTHSHARAHNKECPWISVALPFDWLLYLSIGVTPARYSQGESDSRQFPQVLQAVGDRAAQAPNIPAAKPRKYMTE